MLNWCRTFSVRGVAAHIRPLSLQFYSQFSNIYACVLRMKSIRRVCVCGSIRYLVYIWENNVVFKKNI